jgi:hypothetical protein
MTSSPIAIAQQMNSGGAEQIEMDIDSIGVCGSGVPG